MNVDTKTDISINLLLTWNFVYLAYYLYVLEQIVVVKKENLFFKISSFD